MTKKTVVSVYGYSKNVPTSCRDWASVVDDRTGGAYRMLNFLKEHGIAADLYISGSTLDPATGKTESESMLDRMRSRRMDLEKIVAEVVLDEKATNTPDNNKNISEYAQKTDADAVFGVTSIDHASRAVKEVAYGAPKDRIFGIVPSAGPYSVNGTTFEPIVLEPPFFPDKDTHTAFLGLLKLRDEQKRNIAAAIKSA